jgi:hypothetical protein
MKNVIWLAIGISVLAVPTLVGAQSAPADGDDHHHRGPSPESIAACKAKSEGDACEYDGARGHESGTCHKTPGGELACFHPHHHHDQDAGAR